MYTLAQLSPAWASQPTTHQLQAVQTILSTVHKHVTSFINAALDLDARRIRAKLQSLRKSVPQATRRSTRTPTLALNGTDQHFPGHGRRREEGERERIDNMPRMQDHNEAAQAHDRHITSNVDGTDISTNKQETPIQSPSTPSGSIMFEGSAYETPRAVFQGRVRTV